MPTSAAAWWNASWGLRRKITFDNSAQAQNLVDFPVLVELDASRIEYFRTQGAGEDLRFVDADDSTPLDYEIESWSPGGTSFVWVRVPQVDGGSTTDFIYMYYDNAGALDGQNGTGVWDASHRGVWHLKEDPAGAPPQMKDSTLNTNHGTTEFSPVQAAGQIDGSLSFDGTNERDVNVPHSGSLQLATDMTVSGWASTTSADGQARLIAAKWLTTGSANYWLGKFDASTVHFEVDNGQLVSANLAFVNDGAWHHVVGVADASAGQLRIYVDGIQRGIAAYSGTSQTGTSELRIGRSPDNVFQDWDGGIDEVRVESTARSADWIRAQHLSTADAFASYGPVACAFGCQGLTVTEGSGLVTVTAANAFQVVFATAAGGHLQDYYDLQESPLLDAVHDLAGGASNQVGLFFDEIGWSGPVPPSANYRSDKNPAVGRGVVAPIEVTPTRIMVRSQSYFASGSSVLPGLKGLGDWTVYPAGRVALHWSRISTQAVPINSEQLHLNAHYQTAGPLSTWAAFTKSGALAIPGGAAVPPTPQDFLMFQNEQAGARTDFLQILYSDWTRASNIDASNNAGQEWVENTWHDLGSPHSIPTDTTESWDYLTYFKPTVFTSHTDPAVTSRSADYRGPDDLASPTPPSAGGGWFDPAESTASPSDFFNEKEAAYALDLDPVAGLTFDIDGGTTMRSKPFFKIRQWRSVAPPATITLEGAILTRDVDYKADVMPISRGGIYRDYLWHSTLEDLASITSPDIGSGAAVTGTPTYAAARFGRGTRLSASGDSIQIPLASNFNAAKGSLSFWFRPTWDSADGILHDICGFVSDPNNLFTLEKRSDDGLYWQIKAGGATSVLQVTSANYDWKAGDWVHIQLDWDDTASLANQMDLFFGDRVPTHVDPTVDYDGASLLLTAGSFRFGNTDGDATFAAGLYDEIDIISGVTLLSRAGLLSDSREYFTDPTRNEQLDFMPVDAQRRGRYLSMGATARFHGLNIALAVDGAGVPAGSLVWEYWNGSAWGSLNAVAGFGDTTNALTRSGNVFWTADPPGWVPYSVYGGVEIYRIRVHLPAGFTYSTYPTEGMIRPDILLLQYCGDVTADAQTFSIAAPVPTAVKLLSFTATPLDGAVALAWQTASELDNLGFHLYRRPGPEGPWTRITPSLIPGLGSSPIGASYSWSDSGLVNGQRYEYQLEDIDTSSVSTLHGPVSAVPGVPDTPPPADGDGSGGSEGASGSGGGEESDDGSGSRSDCPDWVIAAFEQDAPPSSLEPRASAPISCTTHGDPTASSLEILSHTRKGALLELRTRGFYALHEPGGAVRVFIPGFDSLSDPSAPALPIRRALVDAMVGRRVRLVSVDRLGLRSFGDLRPSAVGRAEMDVSGDGTVRPVRRALVATRLSRGSLPRFTARLAGTAFLGETKRVVVEIAPVRFDAAARQLVLARRVRVRLAFSGRDAGETGSGSIGRRRRPRPTPGRDTLVQLHTSQRGIYAFSFADVFSGRHRGIPVSSLRLQRQGVPVAFHVEPSSGVFGPGSSLYFYADRVASSTDYSPEIAWELVRSDEGERMGTALATPAEPAAPSPSSAFASFETNRIYQAGLLEAPDIWLWEAVVGGGPSRTVSFDLSGTDSASPLPAQLAVFLQGGSESGRVTDHHLRFVVNGSDAGETSFAGRRPHRVSLSVPISQLREGTNTLELFNLGDTGVSSVVFLDKLSVAYPQVSSLRGGTFEGAWEHAGAVVVGGVSGTPIVLDVTAAAPGDPGAPPDAASSGVTWLTGFHASGGSVRFEVDAGHLYLVATAAGLLHPRVVDPPASSLTKPENQADYILVAPRALMGAARPLLDRRTSQGLSVIAVPFEEITEAFGHGQPSGEAIRDFLSFAYHSWQRPSPRYVLLLGDATSDPQHFLPSSLPSPLPALWTRTSYLWTASDPAIAAVNGEDRFPDLAIGRLPATTPAQADALVAKLLDWEDSAQKLAGMGVLIADDPDLAGDFEADVDDIRASFLADRATSTIRVRELGAGTRSAILAAFDDGASFLSYVGHGGAAVWASENVLNSWDVPSLQAQSEQPVLLTLNCLNGYFVAPAFESLSEALLKAEGRGAIAAFSPSGLSLDAPAHEYHRAIMAELASGRHERLGDAVFAAQDAYARSGLMPELVDVYHLFGDPAMRIR